jgi:chromosome condensin MukBEF MukE localization factor
MLSERDNLVSQWRQEEAKTREEMSKLKLDHERQLMKARTSNATGSDIEIAKQLDKTMVRIDVLILGVRLTEL